MTDVILVWHQVFTGVALGWAILLGLGFLVAAWREPDPAQRILAVDSFGTTMVATLAIVAIRTGDVAYLDAALALALLSFVGTVAAARYHRSGALR